MTRRCASVIGRPYSLARVPERLVVRTTDYHAAGEPFRIVSGGLPAIEGATILEKRRWVAASLDHVRRLLVNEPRGHADMYGCFVVEPDDDGADLGVVFFHNAGYSTACGHGTIALATWMLEAGLVERGEPETELVIDVPSGRLPVVVSVEGGRVTGARFRNVPAWVEAEGLEAAGLTVDVGYGGAFYASAEAPIPVESASLPRLIELGREVKRDLEAARAFAVPDAPDIRDVYGVIFWRDEGEADGALVQRNVTVFADGEVDRSPCGSGTSARLALLHARGQLGSSRELLHQSIVGTEFRARVVEEVQAHGRPAVVTEIAGSAHLTGYHEFVLEPDDELGTGFLLR
jgi:proline racemase